MSGSSNQQDDGGGPPAKKARRIPPELQKMQEEYIKTTPWKGNVDAKLNSAAPFHLFLTRVNDVRSTYDEDLSISFQGMFISTLLILLGKSSSSEKVYSGSYTSK